MPSRKTKKKAQRDLAQGKSASTAAGEFVREEIHHVREGKHGAKSPQQAVAIGLSKARRAGIPVKPGASASRSTKRKAAQEGARAGRRKSPKRSRAAAAARKKEPRSSASHAALSQQSRAAAKRRRKAGGSSSPKAAAERAARTRKRRTNKHARRAPKRA